MQKPIDWKTDPNRVVLGAGLHDGYFYGVLQEGEGLKLYLYDAVNRRIEINLAGITDMNVTNFWIGSIVGDVHLWPTGEVQLPMWERLFAGRIAVHNPDVSLQTLIEKSTGRYFFALEASYGANVYAVCNGMNITADADVT